MTEPLAPPILLDGNFASHSQADWEALVLKSTRGRSVAELSSPSDDGIAINPLYPADSSHGIVARNRPGPWRIVQRIDLPGRGVALPQIEEDVNGGASGIELVFAGSVFARDTGIAVAPAELDALGSYLRQNALPVRIDAGEETPAITARLLKVTRSPEAVAAELVAAFDPLATMAAQGGLRRPYREILATIVALCNDFEADSAAGAAVSADGRIWHAGGASEVQELAAILAAYVAWLRLFDHAGIALARAAARIGIVLTGDADQFLTIAKFRAMRLLIARVLEAAGLAVPVSIHAETAWRMMSRYDVHTNILRTSVAAFAAGLGGADSVTVLPFDAAARLADSFSRRLARNSQTILIEEAGLADVADPAAGSGAVEALTDRLAERAWEAFRTIEAQGGLHNAVRASTIQQTIAAMQERRLQRVRNREIALIGVNAFPAVGSLEGPAPEPARPASLPTLTDIVDALVFTRLPAPFEALRERANHLAAALGKRPAIFLVTMGQPAESAALASEIRQVFASAGMITIAGPSRSTPKEISEAFLASRAEAACICPSGEITDTEILSIFNSLKEKSAALVGLAGKPRTTLSGIDFNIDKGIDVVKLLCNVLQAIAATGENTATTQ